ncbi:ultra-long-chain fatty acid omega-hydroxylase-like [Corticium candelabrum]|uniref:ultra-long-chain fatty acid omega-hydroxylase-like n=1 Tax=Corticium candelabrum TaxID=121492 RepID=UPI002E2528FD|nr:ultra-long-chain fatty acid omega-hydroxylase-like [Corticium candelabrum]
MIVGHLHKLWKGDEEMMQWGESLVEKMPRIFLLWLGPLNVGISLHHPETIRPIAKSLEPKAKQQYGFLQPFIGEGLLISNGDKWSRTRRLLTPAFHFDVLKSYISIYEDATNVLLTKWENHAANGKAFRALNDISLMTLDVMLRCACSHYSNCQNETDHPYINAIRELNELSFRRMMIPPYHSDFIFYLSPMGRKTKRYCDLVHEFSEKVIRERKAALKQSQQKNDLKSEPPRRRCLDFLDILLLARDESGLGLTEREIRDEVDTFVFEGHDTTASGIIFSLYCLAKYADHQDKCYEEACRILESKESIEWEDLAQLSYTTMCIKEALRLYPPVPSYFRDITEDTTIDGYKIPKGSWVGVNVHLMHRNPTVWPHPSEFEPERFLANNCANWDPYQYIPFAAGPRNCIGQNFALNEMKVAVAHIVHRFVLSVDKSYVVKRTPSPISKPVDGLTLYVADRAVSTGS